MGARKRALTPDYCEIPFCEWKYAVQRHRIFPGREGGKYRKGNVIALCPNDHFCADHGIYHPEDLKAIVDKRLAKEDAELNGNS